MKHKLSHWLFWIFVVHVLVCLLFNMYPQFLADTSASKIYRTYFLPGPFFRDDRIIESRDLCISWKDQSQWTARICPAREKFNRYQHDLNPVYLYESRFIRAMYQQVPFQPGVSGHKDFKKLIRYVKEEYVPPGVDSIRLTLVQKRAMDFEVQLDTIRITLYE